MAEGIEWTASISGMIAAVMIAVDGGRRLTGTGFVVFTASSLFWIWGALLKDTEALWTQNLVLLAINMLGVYRYLIRRPRNADDTAPAS